MNLIISSSMNPKSKSYYLALQLETLYHKTSSDTELIDLRDYQLPLCDGSKSFSDHSISLLSEKISNAKGLLLVSPIYNYDLNSTLKTLLENTGQSWRHKVIGLACVAGGHSSYMAPLSFINSLMLDFRCLVLPNYVYSVESDFKDQKLHNQDIFQRLCELVKAHHSLSNFWNQS